MHVFDLLIVFQIERVHFVYTNVEYVLISTVHKMALTMDAPPMMFVGVAIQRVHALQDTGHMNAHLAAPHTDCGIEHLPGQLEILRDATNVKQWLEVHFTGIIIRQTHHAPPLFLVFPDAGTEFSCFLGTSLLHHLSYHLLEPVLLGPLLLDDIPDGIAPALTTWSSLVFGHDVADGVT